MIKEEKKNALQTNKSNIMQMPVAVRNFPSANAITLIALVITIIVLLILAGVTISLTLGENGIFRLAEQAGEETKKATTIEKLETEILNIKTKKIAQGENITKENLKELENIGASVKNTDTSTIVEYEGYEFNIDENYTVTIVNKDDSIKNINLKKLETEGKIRFTSTGGVSDDGTLELHTGASWSDSYAYLDIDEDLHNYSKFSVTFSYIPGYTYGYGLTKSNGEIRIINSGTDGNWPTKKENETEEFDIPSDCDSHKLWFRAGSHSAKLYVYNIKLIK